jgi:hypothetical protein
MTSKILVQFTAFLTLLLFAHCTGCNDCDGPKKEILVTLRLPPASSSENFCMHPQPYIDNQTILKLNYTALFSVIGRCANGDRFEIDAKFRNVSFDPYLQTVTYAVAVPYAVGKTFSLTYRLRTNTLAHNPGCPFQSLSYLDPRQATLPYEYRFYRTADLGGIFTKDMYDQVEIVNLGRSFYDFTSPTSTWDQ